MKKFRQEKLKSYLMNCKDIVLLNLISIKEINNENDFGYCTRL